MREKVSHVVAVMGAEKKLCFFLGYGGFKVNLQKLFATLLAWTGFRLS